MIDSNTFRTSNGSEISPAEVINRHRRQLIIHSYLYYWLDDPIWSDDKWQQVANDLVELQVLYPDPTGVFDNEFKDWDGSTGMHLPHNEAVACMATAVYRIHKDMNHEVL